MGEQPSVTLVQMKPTTKREEEIVERVDQEGARNLGRSRRGSIRLERLQVGSDFADGVSATAASEVSSRNVKVSCR